MITRRRRTLSEAERQIQDKSESTYTQSASFITQTETEQKKKPSTLSVSEMTCRDRTNEFMSTVKSMQGRMGNGYLPNQQNKKARDFQDWGDFMRIAKHIGKDISQTFTKLEKLTLLAKRKSLFDDKPVEIQELTYIIKQDIGSLNKQIAQLQEFVKARKYQNRKHMQSHSNSVVVSLQSKLASMSNDFKQVLEVRTENLKHQKNRREQFTKGAVSSALPPSAMAGHSGSVLLSDDQVDRGGGAYTINMDEVGRIQSQQQMQLLDEQDSYIQSRTDTMQNIEATIVELGTIFQQLAVMVKEQDEMVQRIDANVEDTQLNVEAAHTEILKYFQSVTSNRWLMIKVFAVLIVFFIIFVVFVA